jgi:hypothetical protein
MSLATLREVKEEFFSLSRKEQETILKEIYNFSKDVKEFINVRLLRDGENKFIEDIKKATESSTPTGRLKMIKVSKVNSILSKAKKSKVTKETLCDMHWYAFDGYVTFLNDYGGGPDSYENKAYDHFKNYLRLLVEISDDKQKLEEKLLGIENYLNQHQNMYNDHLWELYKDVVAEYIHVD